MRRSLIATLAAGVLLLSGCSMAQQHEDARGRGDAPVSGRKGDDSPATCTNMPDEFGNICGKCLAGFPPWAVAVTTHYRSSSNVVIFQYPQKCGGVYDKNNPASIQGTNNSPAPPSDDES
jgi:hypothetical protein